MYIKVGKLIDRSLIRKLLQVVPPQDIEGLKSICIRTVVHKNTKKEDKRWGGICGSFSGYGDKGTGRIWLFLWGISQKTLSEFSYSNNNLYISFVENLARTLYHEVGHHVHSKTYEYKDLKERQRRLVRELRKLRRKGVFTEEYQFIVSETNEMGIIVEGFAEEYAETTLNKARKFNLLERPLPNEVRFFNIMRQKFIDKHLQHFKESHKRDWCRLGAIFDHLRKCKLGDHAKYNLRDAFNKIFDTFPDRPSKNELQSFRRFALNHVTPLWYTSKSGRKYAYLSDGNIGELTRITRENPELSFGPLKDKQTDPPIYVV